MDKETKTKQLTKVKGEKISERKPIQKAQYIPMFDLDLQICLSIKPKVQQN